MSFESEFKSGLRELAAANGNKTATVRGETISVIDDPAAFTDVLTDGGVERRRLLTLTAPKEPNMLEPKIGDPVVFDGRTYKINEVDEDDASYVLRCISPNTR